MIAQLSTKIKYVAMVYRSPRIERKRKIYPLKSNPSQYASINLLAWQALMLHKGCLDPEMEQLSGVGMSDDSP